MVAGELKLSAKDKKILSTGSFDWVHTSKVSNIFGDHFDTFKKEVSGIREMDIENRVTRLSSTRKKFADTCSAGFDYLSDKQVCDLIDDSISDGIDWVFVNDKENNVLYQFNPEDHPERWHKLVILLSSLVVVNHLASIFVKDGVEYNYGIRLQHHL